MNERFDFAPTYLRRTLWRIMIEVDRFYDHECTPEMFKRGHGPIPWPTHTTLSSLLSKFMDTEEMRSRSFPEEWSAEFYQKKSLLGSPGGAKGRGGGGGYIANGGRGHSGGGHSGGGDGGYSGDGGRSYSGGYSGGGGGYHGNQGGGQGGANQGYKPQSPPQGGGRSGNNTAMEACHDKIKTMMKPYWQKFGGRVRFDQILDAANMNVWDLPQLDRHLDGNGKNRLCWPNLLGCCTRGNCSFMHESGRELPEAFAEDACLKLESGIRWVVNNESDLRGGPFRTAGGAG